MSDLGVELKEGSEGEMTTADRGQLGREEQRKCRERNLDANASGPVTWGENEYSSWARAESRSSGR